MSIACSKVFSPVARFKKDKALDMCVCVCVCVCHCECVFVCVCAVIPINYCWPKKTTRIYQHAQCETAVIPTSSFPLFSSSQCINSWKVNTIKMKPQFSCTGILLEPVARTSVYFSNVSPIHNASIKKKNQRTFTPPSSSGSRKTALVTCTC